MVKTRHLFISHSWNHSGHYETVKEFLEDAPRFDFVNHSVPKDDPIHNEESITKSIAALIGGAETQKPRIPQSLSDAFSPPKPLTTESIAALIGVTETPKPRIPQSLLDAFSPSTSLTLRNAIKAKIDKSDIVLVIAGVYASYSKWIDIEIDIAQESNTPILAIECWGAKHTSAEVKAAANKIVRWNTLSIVTAIRDLVP